MQPVAEKHSHLYFVDLTSLLFSANGRILALSPQEHFSYYSVDGALGYLVFSQKYDMIVEQFFPL